MPIGQSDLDNAVREGWIRDEDNEISIDGYNATLEISTNDGTSGFHVKNSTGAVSFSAKTDGDGYFAKNLGIGTYYPETQLEVIGKTRTDQLQVTDGVVSGYVLTADGDGNATWQPTGAATSGVSETTFQENKAAQGEINDTILASLDGYALDITVTENKNAQEQINQSVLQALDGYAQDSTESEHYEQLSQAIQDIVSVIDGYSTDTEFAGLTNTVTENNNQQQQINQSVFQALDGYAIRAIEDQRWVDSSQQLQDLRDSLDGYVVNQTFEENKNTQEQVNQSIRQALDGYAQDSTESEHYTQLSQAIQDIISVIDGYSTDVEFAGLTNTVTENNNQQQQINQSIRQALDGYASDVTVSEHYQQFGQAIQDILSTIDGYSSDTELSGLITTEAEHTQQQNQINQTILQALDGYAYVPDTNAVSDGYVAFFIDNGKFLAGDNDLYFDRVNNQLQISALKLSTTPVDGYVLTSDTSGNATWQENISSPTNHRNFDQLVHNVAESSYEVYTYTGSDITNITVWTSTEMVTKIREEQFTYTGSRITTIVTIQYDNLGVATETLTENLTYSGNDIVNITRTLT